MIRKRKISAGRKREKSSKTKFRNLQQILTGGKNQPANLVTEASNGLQEGLRQAQAAVLAARQAMVQGTREFQESSSLWQQTTEAAEGDTLVSLRESQASIVSAKSIMLEGLKKLSESFARAANWDPANPQQRSAQTQARS